LSIPHGRRYPWHSSGVASYGWLSRQETLVSVALAFFVAMVFLSSFMAFAPSDGRKAQAELYRRGIWPQLAVLCVTLTP
jgi:hypothetical protein